MPDSKDEERDEEWFKEVYGKDYTGRTRPGNEMAREDSSSKKRAITQAAPEVDEEDAPLDPNAVPTDFTSREAKVWEAKAKAIERNWKKKKEEELICRICGEYGHFSQGCPTTLGVNRKQGEVVERVPVKDKRLKPRIIGTAGATIQGIERETGCRLQLEDNLTGGNGAFSVRISGKNHVMVGRAVDAVKKLIDQVQVDRKPHPLRKPHGAHNRVSNMDSLRAAQMQHVAHQRMQQDSSLLSHPGQDVPFTSDQYSNVEQLEASHAWESESQNGPYAYGYKGGSQYDDGRVSLKGTGNSRDQHHGSNVIDQQPIAKSLEALEHRFVEETMQLTKDANEAEDKENARHRETMREIQEQFQQKMVTLRAQQAKRREEFLRHEAQLRQQEYQHYQQSQASPNYYSYDMGGSLSGFNSGAREPLGYGLGLADRNETFAGYSSFRGEGAYYNNNPMRPYRNGAHESGMFHSGGNQSYDAGPYRY